MYVDYAREKKEEEKVESIHFVLLFRIEYQSNLPFSIYLPGEMEANIGRPEQQKKKDHSILCKGSEAYPFNIIHLVYYI